MAPIVAKPKERVRPIVLCARLADKIPVALEAPGVATNLPATGILSASLGDSFFCVKLLPILYQRTEGRDGRMT